MKPSRRVLIVGGGVAGPVLALFLQKAGIPSSVFEAAPGPTAAGGGLGLEVNGLAVLKAAGVLEKIQARSVQAACWAFENQSGKTLAKVPTIAHEDNLRAVMITRAALHQSVAEAAQAAGADMQYGKRLTDIEDHPDGPVVLHFEDGSTAEGDLLIGADGIRSQVRRCVMPDAPPPQYTGMLSPGGYSPALGPVEAGSPQTVHFVFGREGFFGYVNALTDAGPRTMWWSTAQSTLPSRDEMAAMTKESHQRRLLDLHGDWAAPIPQLIESTNSEILYLPIHDVPALPSWSSGRTLLIGDAAHAVAPHSGQGASMALEDAMLLARMLRDIDDVKEVFRQFEAERRPRTDRVIAMGRRNAQRKQTMTPMEYWFQQQAMRLLMPIMLRRNQDWLLQHRIAW